MINYKGREYDNVSQLRGYLLSLPMQYMNAYAWILDEKIFISKNKDMAALRIQLIDNIVKRFGVVFYINGVQYKGTKEEVKEQVITDFDNSGVIMENCNVTVLGRVLNLTKSVNELREEIRAEIDNL